MKKGIIKKSFSLAGIIFIASFFNCCNSWMQDDGFFDKVDEEVRVASAKEIDVFVRCAATKMGTTTPNGYAVFKQNVVSSVSVVPETDYGFWRWAAFSTENFDPNKQHTALICDDPASYEEKYGALELTSDVVYFEEPKSESTNVKILEDRKDIVLVPVCVDRPALSVSIPGSGETGVVRNMSIRLLFSKPMDPASFTDEESGTSNFTFYQGRATITESSDVSLTDISDYFDEPQFSIENKLVTFNLKSGKLFNANGQITVRFTGDIKDIYGYTVASGSSFQFRVGTAVDSAAPGIDALTFGVDGKYDTFKDIYSKYRSEANVASVKGVSDELCATDLSDSAYDNIVTYRTKSNNVNIYVHGIEYKGSSKGKLNASGDEAESDIVIIGTRSCLVYDRDGNATGNNIEEEKVVEIDYAAGVTYSPEVGENDYNESTGTLFGYDISNYPDGLIRIDVALADSVGNSGFDASRSNSENDNGYKTVFIIKDTSAPDAEAIKDVIQSDSVAAVYQWYNAETLASIRFKDTKKDDPVGGIVDSGHYRLRSAKSNMKWIFHYGTGDEWTPSADDAGWKPVSDSYELKNAVAPADDGNIPISVAFMDDLGFISSVVTVSAITYDNTKPTVDSYLWVDSSNSETLNNSSAATLSQYLKVGFTEVLSGIRRIAVKVARNGSSVDGLSGVTKVYYSATDAFPASASPLQLTLMGDGDSGYVFYEIPDALNSGYFFIQGIPIAEENGKYDVSVELIDAALNLSPVTDPIALYKDTTQPVVDQASVLVENISERPGDSTHWLSTDKYTGTSVSFVVNETGSGIKYIKLAGSIRLKDTSAILVNGEVPADAVLEVASNKITFSDFKIPAIFGSAVAVTIKEVEFTNINSADGNSVLFTIEDFASTGAYNFEYVKKVYADSVKPTVASIVLHDNDTTTTWTDGTNNYRELYTNSKTMKATVILGTAEQGDLTCSGVKELKINGATVGGATVSTGETCTVDGSTITFNPPLRTGGETVELTGVSLILDGDGTRTIQAYATDFAAWTGDETGSSEIILDTVKPAVSSLEWTVTSAELIPGLTKEQVVDNQTLNINFTEATAGVKSVTVQVKRENADTSDSLSSANLVVEYGDTPLVLNTDYTKSGDTLVFTTPKLSGLLKIRGLTIDTTVRDGDYVVSVSLTDAAENVIETESTESIKRDTINPAISKVVIPEIKSLKKYGDTTETPVYFIDNTAGMSLNAEASAVTAQIYITEKTAGIQTLTFGDGTDLVVTDASVFTVFYTSNNTSKVLAKTTDYTVDAAGKIITFINGKSPVVRDESDGFYLEISNCKFVNTKTSTNTNDGLNNLTAFSVKDFAQLSSNRVDSVQNGPEYSIDKVLVDSTPAKFMTGTLSLIDRGKNDTEYDLLDSFEGYTNYEVINLYVDSMTYSQSTNFVKNIELTGAGISDSQYDGKSNTLTKIYAEIDGNKNELIKDTHYTVSEDKKIITFTKVFSDSTKFILENVLLDDIEDGEKTVKLIARAPTDLTDETGDSAISNKIKLDKTKPKLDPDGPYAYHHGDSSYFNGEYPRQSTVTGKDNSIHGIKASTFRSTNTKAMNNGTDGTDIVYFYTKNEYARCPITIIDSNPLSTSKMQVRIVNSIEAGKADSKKVLEVSASENIISELNGSRIGYVDGTGDSYKQITAVSGDSNPYTYVAADAAGNVTEPHQFYVIKDATPPSKTYDGSDFNTNLNKSLVNLMTLECPAGKTVYRNNSRSHETQQSATDFYFWENNSTHSCEDIYVYNYVLSDDSYKIHIRLGGVKENEKLIGGDSATKDLEYSERIPTATQSGIAAYAISRYYYKWIGKESDTNWICAYPTDTLGSNIKKTNKIDWIPYVPGQNGVTEDGDIDYVVSNTLNVGLPPLTLLLKDNCGNVSQVMIRPKTLEAEDNSVVVNEETLTAMTGDGVSWIFDKKLPALQTFSDDNQKNLSDQFIIFAGACDGNEKDGDGNFNGKNISEKITSFATGCDRFGSLYRNGTNKTQYYNHNVYLQLQINSKEPICWNAQEECTNNVQPLYEEDVKPSDFTLRARVLFRDGTSTTAPDVSEFAGSSSDSLTKWSYFKQKTGDGTRLWNIHMPHGDEGAVGTMWLFMEDYVGNKKIFQVYNGASLTATGTCTKFCYNNEPPKVAVVDDSFDSINPTSETRGSNFTDYGTYRYYNHLGYSDKTGDDFVSAMERLVPPTKYAGKQHGASDRWGGISAAEINKLYPDIDSYDVNKIFVDGEKTYYGTTYHAVVGSIHVKLDDSNENTVCYSNVLSNFNIKVSTSPSGVKKYKYWTTSTSTNEVTQTGDMGDNKEGKWYQGNFSTKYGSNLVNTNVPIGMNLNNNDLYLYICDNVGNLSITKLGKKWTQDSTFPRAVVASGKYWNEGHANPGNSYIKQPYGDSDISIIPKASGFDVTDGNEAATSLKVTLAGSSQNFKEKKNKQETITVNIPASWYEDDINGGSRTNNISGSANGSGVYGAGLVPNVIGAAKPVITIDGKNYLPIDIPYSVYNNLYAASNQKLEFYIFDKTGNYWTCLMYVNVDASAPTMRVGVTRINNSSTFHSVDNLYTAVYGAGAVPTGQTADTVSTEAERLETQGNALKTFTNNDGYSKNAYTGLYSLASNVSKQYVTKDEVDTAYMTGDADDKKRFFKIRCNNHSFFVNAWAEDDGGISQVAIRRWDGSAWNSVTALGKLEYTNENQSVTTMKFEGIPSVDSNELSKLQSGSHPCPDSGKIVDSDPSIRNSIYVSTISQTSETLYEVSATDFAGNAVFYYAYILPYDNVGPSIKEAKIEGNDGSSYYNSKFYFNSLTATAKVSDAAVGRDADGNLLGAFKNPNSTSWIISTADTALNTTGNYSYTYTDLSTEGTCNVKFETMDILGNSSSNNKWTIGTESNVSSFVYDKTKPVISTLTAKRTWDTGNSWEQFNEDIPASKITKSGNTYTVKIENPSKAYINIKPKFTDTNIRGFIVSDEVISTPTYSDHFKDATINTNETALKYLAAPVQWSWNETTNQVEKIADPDAVIVTEDGHDKSSATKYIYAIDYAGNISDVVTVKMVYGNVAPVFDSVSAIENVTYVDSGSKCYVYAPDKGMVKIRYYVKDSGFPVTHVQYFYGDNNGDRYAEEVAVTPDGENSLSDGKYYNTVTLPLPRKKDIADSRKKIYVKLKSSAGISNMYQIRAGTGTQYWKLAYNGPAVPTTAVLTSSDSGTEAQDISGFMFNSSDKKLYYKSGDKADAYLYFTVGDDSIGVSTATNESVSGNIKKHVKINDLLSTSSATFYAYDRLLNISGSVNVTDKGSGNKDVFTVTPSGYVVSFINDDTAPTITSVTPTVNEYAFIDTVNNCIWFNGSGVIGKTPSVTLAVVASDGTGSGIKSYNWTSEVDGVGVDSTGAVSGFEYITGECTLTLTVTDNVGNASTSTVVLKKDSVAPTGLALTGIDGVTAENEAAYVYCADSNWKNEVGKTVYYNSNKITLTSNVFTIDSALEDSGSGLASPSTVVAVSGNDYTVTAKDNVGNETIYSVTLIADNAAPAPDSNYYSTGNTLSSLTGASVNLLTNKKDNSGTPYGLTSGSAYLAHDSAVGSNYATVMYTSGAECKIPVASDTGAGGIQYALKYGNTSDVYSTAPESWADMPSESNAFEVSLPAEAVVHGYLFIWFKDKVGNTSAFQMGNPDVTNINQGSGYNWMACQKAISSNSITAAYGSSDTTLVLSGIDAGSPVKSVSITLTTPTLEEGQTDTNVFAAGEKITVTLAGLGVDGVSGTSTTKEFTITADGKTVTIELDNGPRIANGSLSVKFNKDVSIESITLNGKNDGDTVSISTVGSRSLSLLTKVSSSISSAIGSIFGRSDEERNLTSEQRKQLRADKKAARQAEIAAAKEAKKQAKLLAKQQKEEARKLKERLASSVNDADVKELESAVATAGTKAAALASGETMVETNASGIDQWNNAVAGGSAYKKTKERSVPVAPVAAAVALLVIGSGAFVIRRRRK